jgi:hypothetical protein
MGRLTVTCRDAIAMLGDYLEAVLGEDVLRRLEDYLRDCAPCVAYLNTYRRTREMAAEVNRIEMPEEMRGRLREFLLSHLRTRQPEPGAS